MNASTLAKPTTIQDEDRRDPRYQAAEDTHLTVELELLDGDESRPISGELVDISNSGCKISLNESVPSDEQANLRIVVETLEKDFTVSVAICWSRAGLGDWYVGCSFLTDLPESFLEELAVSGLVNRRQDDRSDTNIKALVNQELSGGTDIEAVVENYSSGGFRLSTAEALEVGGRLLLKIKNDSGKVVNIPARAVWHSETNEGHAVGCSFLNNDGSDILRQLVQPKKETVMTENTKQSLRLSPWCWGGLFVVIVWFGAYTIFHL